MSSTSDDTAALDPADLTPAATVVLLRDGAAGLETLMLHRDSKVAFGGMWAFPGGRVEDGDLAGDGRAGEGAARRAACREALEECSLAVEPDDLVPWAYWVPPATAPRRFATWFFLARAADGEVVVDDGEIRDHRWLAPSEVLALHATGEVDLPTPTWMTLNDLAALDDVASALAVATGRDPLPRYVTRMFSTEGGRVALWAGDAGYEAGVLDVPGPRHRLWMLADGWRLERTEPLGAPGA